MVISFSNIPLVISCLLGLAILALHFVSAFAKGMIKRAATPVAILLHLGAIVLLFFAGAELDIVVTSLMASLFAYSAMSYASYLMSKNKEVDNDV